MADSVKARVRDFVLEDSPRVACRHTALTPLTVIERKDGLVVVVAAKCHNCGMELMEWNPKRIYRAHST